jgi:hypothetical protein
MVALAAQGLWHIRHLDFKIAFLNNKLHHTVYIKQPQGYVVQGQERKVCVLDGALYGLRQSAREWYLTIDHTLRSPGLSRSSSDSNLYFFHEQGRTTILLLYVDDMYLTGDHQEKLDWLRQRFTTTYKMTDLELLHHSLGLEFLHSPTGITITQRSYVQHILRAASLESCNPARTPMLENLHLTTETGTPSADVTQYQRLIGQCHFLLQTHPDIQYAVNILSRFTAALQQTHPQALHHLLCYLCGTLDYGLHYRRGEASILLGYVDADWAGDRDDRKSNTGYMFHLRRTPVTWRTHK